jgi:gliding motility-associated-like protein
MHSPSPFALLRGILLAVLVLVASGVRAQGYPAIWHFGFNAGLDFNGAAPVPLLDGQLSNLEGCATITDGNGELMFYTDGQIVWDRDHVVMPNGFGLMGDYSSTQSGVIVPLPGSTTQFYVFTLAQAAESNGFRYSIVDMSLNGGNGDVITANVPVLTPACEKLAVVAHANGSDYWVIVHRFGDDAFLSYLLTPGGLSAVPVQSNVGVTVNSGDAYAGYLCASMDGTRLAAAYPDVINLVQVYDFDPATGSVSNAITLNGFATQGLSSGVYGVEFSPSGQFLYTAEANPSTSRVYQFDLLAGDAAAINASRVLLHTFSTYGGALQLGPDMKIYCTSLQASALDVIQDPDLAGTACGYVVGGQPLGGFTTALGLPNFIDAYFTTGIEAEGFCTNAPTTFTFTTGSSPDSLRWDFGDPLSGPLNTSTLPAPSHLYGAAGTYTVTLTLYQGTAETTETIEVELNAAVAVDLGPDTALCAGQALVLDPGVVGGTLLWSTGATTPAISVNADGTYWLQATTAEGCVSSDTIAVVFNALPVLAIADVEVCADETVVLDAGNAGSSYAWSTGATAQLITIEGVPGTYAVTVTTPEGCAASDEVNVLFVTYPLVDLGPDAQRCEQDTFRVSLPDEGYAIAWSTGASGTEAELTQSGELFVTVANGACVSRDTVAVVFHPLPEDALEDVRSLCFDRPPYSTELDAANPGSGYSWSTGEDAQLIEVEQYGLYEVLVTTALGCSRTELIRIEEDCPPALYLPNSFTPNGDGVNDLFGPVGYRFVVLELNVFDRWGAVIWTGSGGSLFWDGTVDGQEAMQGVYVWDLLYRVPGDGTAAAVGDQRVRGHVTVLR